MTDDATQQGSTGATEPQTVRNEDGSVTTTWPDGSQTTTSETTATTASPEQTPADSPEQYNLGGEPDAPDPGATQFDAAAEEGARQEKIAEARATLKVAVAAFGAAITAVSELGLNPLEELTQAGFDTGLGTLPDVMAETPPNQLPPV